ncbi:hypothetical protein C9374_013603 [Naegleria lovaniensis]|uniref:Uncharacterized protein n=1 Tax=Naegleria lovaniensis TaxID=51637 RepID=A0AA88GW39_NAELO|nr:uncharacterized protein C9374_013603 [Naegleria lovaniensis]KAG2392118.1 hypothetical protein C9374_013603 [Naegleria lovaniensis]
MVMSPITTTVAMTVEQPEHQNQKNSFFMPWMHTSEKKSKPPSRSSQKAMVLKLILFLGTVSPNYKDTSIATMSWFQFLPFDTVQQLTEYDIQTHILADNLYKFWMHLNPEDPSDTTVEVHSTTITEDKPTTEQQKTNTVLPVAKNVFALAEKLSSNLGHNEVFDSWLKFISIDTSLGKKIDENREVVTSVLDSFQNVYSQLEITVKLFSELFVLNDRYTIENYDHNPPKRQEKVSRGKGPVVRLVTRVDFFSNFPNVNIDVLKSHIEGIRHELDIKQRNKVMWVSLLPPVIQGFIALVSMIIGFVLGAFAKK